MACVFLPVLTGVAVTNYVIDPGEVYSNRFVDKIIEGNSKNFNVTNTPKNINDRAYKTKLCKLYNGKTFDYVILGNSRANSISSEMFPDSSSILNLWVNSGKLEDYLSFYEICKENNIRYKYVVICADPPNLLNENYLDAQWMALEDYCNIFLHKEKEFHLDFSRFENLFSLSYFQTALKTESPEDLKFVATRVNKGRTIRTDGSKSYDTKVRNSSVENSDRMAKTEMPSMFNDFDSVSKERAKIFESLIQAIKDEGADVIFFCCPFHPVFYKRVEGLQGLQDGMRYIEDYAMKNNIPMIGHFNLNDDGYDNKDFIDHFHPRSEYVEKLFKQYFSNRGI